MGSWLVLLGPIVAVRPVVGKPGLAGLLESGLAGLADALAAAFVFVERGGVADAGVQPNAVPVHLQPVELGAQHRRFGDGQQVRPLGFEVTENVSIQAWSVGVPGRPKWVAMACRAMNSLVEPEVICGPLSLTASRMGRAGSSVPGSASGRPVGPSSRTITSAIRSSRSNASVNTTWTLVEVSSPETMVASHLRETRSSMTVAATPARVKCVVS